jgi:hypothetical protein
MTTNFFSPLSFVAIFGFGIRDTALQRIIMQLLLFAGLFASVLGGMAIGLAYMVAGLLACTAGDLALAPPQWKLILVAGVGGLLGSLIDSLIGKAVES